MKRNYRAVLFDLDGTLADSLADLANATNAALQAVGCPPHPPARYRIMVGDGARTLCIRAVPADRPELVDEVRRRMRDHYAAHCFDETRLYPGILELVRALADRGCQLAVLSNKPNNRHERKRSSRQQDEIEVRGSLANFLKLYRKGKKFLPFPNWNFCFEIVI